MSVCLEHSLQHTVSLFRSTIKIAALPGCLISKRILHNRGRHAHQPASHFERRLLSSISEGYKDSFVRSLSSKLRLFHVDTNFLQQHVRSNEPDLCPPSPKLGASWRQSFPRGSLACLSWWNPWSRCSPRTHPRTFRKAHPPWQGQAIAAGECGRNYPRVLPTPSLPCSARKRSAFQTRDGSRVLNWLRRVIRAPGRTPPGLRASARVRLTLQMLTFPGKDVLSSLWSDPWGVGATGTRGARLPGTGEKGGPRCHEGASRGGSVPSTAVGSPPKWACQRGSPVGSIPGAGSASPQGSPGWGRTPILVAQTGQARNNKGTPRATGETPPRPRGRSGVEPYGSHLPKSRAASERGGHQRNQV